MYDPPCRSVEILRSSISNPVTENFCSLYSKARGKPTYPSPIMPTLAWLCWILFVSSAIDTEVSVWLLMLFGFPGKSLSVCHSRESYRQNARVLRLRVVRKTYFSKWMITFVTNRTHNRNT